MASFEVLDVWRPIPTELAYYRVLIRPDIIKYFVVDKPSPERFPYEKVQHLAFSTVPEGDWTIAHLAHNEENKLVIESVESKRLPDITEGWHPVRIDLQSLGVPLLDPSEADSMYQGYSTVDTFQAPPGLDVPRVLALWETWYYHPVSTLTRESQYRKLIQGQGIAPRFLGHLTENGSRIIGFMLESVNARPATINDLVACRTVLQKLHDLGIAHGNVIRDNFLILDGGNALLKGFFDSYQTSDRAVLDEELAMIEKALVQPLLDEDDEGVDEDMSRQLHEIRERDDGIHPVVLWEAQKEGRITITSEEHRALLDMLWYEGGQLWMDEHMEHALRCREANNGRWYPMSLPDSQKSRIGRCKI